MSFRAIRPQKMIFFTYSIHYFHQSMELAMTSALTHQLRCSGTIRLARKCLRIQEGHFKNVLVIMKPAAASFIDFL
jgi:hypothetical protein